MGIRCKRPKLELEHDGPDYEKGKKQIKEEEEAKRKEEEEEGRGGKGVIPLSQAVPFHRS